jgi:putative thioredoxin
MKTLQEALDASYNAPTLVMVTSPTCGPCKAMKPVMERLTTELEIPYLQVDAGEVKDWVMELKIRAVPTIVVLKQGIAVATAAGGRTEGWLRMFMVEEQITQRELPL